MRLFVCYSKLRASILTKLGLVTISSWLNFGRPAPHGKGVCGGAKIIFPPYDSQRVVFASQILNERFFIFFKFLKA